MPLNKNKSIQLGEWLQLQRKQLLSDFELKGKVDQIIGILLGDICAQSFPSLTKLLERGGVSKEEFDRMTIYEQSDIVTRLLPRQTTQTEDLIAALDMIFEARYGWPEGTVADLGFREVLMALEHATEYDDPARPSIWQVTK